MALIYVLKEEGAALKKNEAIVTFNCPVQANFDFELESVRTCNSCGGQVIRTESFSCLPVDLVPGGSVQDSLDQYFKPCELEVRCQYCGGQQASVVQKFQSLPRVLLLQVKRFNYNVRRGKLVKLQDQLKISPDLNLGTHSVTKVQPPRPMNWQDLSSSLSQRAQIHKPSGSSDETSRHQGGDVPSTARSQYKISSVVSHIGSSINHGHYVSDSLDGSDRWLSFDDDIVQERAQEKVLQKRGDRAYLLFYEHR
ncbi:hypothetical protein JZ751_004711 [Albula glossodonta]|uniref:USP domain-containing protein n=1 Tax=Albula glossodonta TaxID=121402 RepID=A0A8T2MRR2_9TELE|nr:hypothetical protein JZ751_014077 [Albula glossodonta]KAG9329445.1 hypothetical protein JZ751_004711 [Albula glossodonta]